MRSSPILDLIRADVAAQVDEARHPGRQFWLHAIGKAIIQPQVHVVMLHRLSHVLYRWPLRPVAFLLRSLAVVLGGADIHPAARIGPGFALMHSFGVVIGPAVVIGGDARFGHGVTIGEPGRGARRHGHPTLGDHVTVGVGSVILGRVRIGDGAIIGANSVVTHDVPAGAVVAGSPAMVIRWDRGDSGMQVDGNELRAATDGSHDQLANDRRRVGRPRRHSEATTGPDPLA